MGCLSLTNAEGITRSGDPASEWLEHIVDMLDAETGVLFTLRPDGQHSFVAQGHTERAVAEYRDYYYRLDPLPGLLSMRPAGRAIVVDTTTHPAYVAQRELSADYLRPHGIDHVIAAQWHELDGTLRIVSVQRFHGSAPFPNTRGKECDRLIHRWRFDDACPAREIGDHRDESCRRSFDVAAQLDIPLVVVDPRLALLWSNRAATSKRGSVWAALFDGRTQHSGEVALRLQLQELVLTSLRQRLASEALLAAQDGTWFATAVPLEGHLGLALLRLSPMHQVMPGLRERLRRLFGLTTAEAQITILLANGGSLEAISEVRGVSVDTVRAQLRRVFQKTGMHRQGEVICAVARLAAE